MNSTQTEIVVIGAGAAGLMAAIAAARAGARVRVLDGAKHIGAKILVSGGSRCNVTNEYVAPARFHGEGAAPFVTRILRSFSPADTHRFFAQIGVELKLEETGKFFPVSDSSRTVLNALLKELGDSGAILSTQTSVCDLEKEEDGWKISIPDEEIFARAVILCSGGLALPKTGSDGRGYRLARKFGHTLIQTTPALTPLVSRSAPHAKFSGLTLPVRLQFRKKDGARLAAYDGSFLFTHFGYSGPAALNLSRHVARDREKFPDSHVTLRLLPDVAEGAEAGWWHEFSGRGAKKTFAGAMNEILPGKLAATMPALAKIAPQITLGRFDKTQIAAAKSALFEMPLPVDEVADYVKAETTAGGIALEEIAPATMMSRLAPGLFFAGEVCDVDGWLGGYNFQWAWSSGVVAGRAAAKLVKAA
ncbi:MAG: aminoacetone oxidase family FAD-binding enzyme [Armatimonadetes bacterium]|nr:aminoacetone oxidase family FAD-binding enzyme [Armatimonadota bacterium]